MKINNSQQLFKRACQSIAGGVNSPVRSFTSVNLQPLFITKGAGSKIYDADNNEYIDFVGSWGPLILGHNNQSVREAVIKAASKGLSYGAPCEEEIILAEKVKELVPSIELIRMVNSGTEATMSALRLARGFTGKNKIIKFSGCYHGHADFLLLQAGSGSTTLNIPNSAGVPESLIADTLLADFNNIAQVEQLLEENSNDVAAIIIEPIAGNMGLITPQVGFLQKLRKICDLHSVLLIFDEVMTGFRVAKGGAQELYSVLPDLTCLGKIIGGGLPVGAYGGRKDIMERLAPLGNVYQAGTLSGNPIAMSAGVATLDLLDDSFYQELGVKTSFLINSLKTVFEKYNLNYRLNAVGSMFGFFLLKDDFKGEILNYETVKKVDQQFFSKLFKLLLLEGIYIAPSAFEVGFISLMHSEADLNQTVTAFDKALGKLINL